MVVRTALSTWPALAAILVGGCAFDGGGIDGSAARPAVVFVSVGHRSCSGALVGPRAILTLAACVEGADWRETAAFFGEDVNGLGTWIDAAGILVHPDGQLAMVTLVTDAPAVPLAISPSPITESLLGAAVLVAWFDVRGAVGEAPGELFQIEPDSLRVGGDEACPSRGGPILMAQGGTMHVIGLSGPPAPDGCPAGVAQGVRADVHRAWILGVSAAAAVGSM